MIVIDENDPEDFSLQPNFSPRDVTIKRNTNAKDLYEIIGEIGRGKFGTVYKCREKATGLKLAAKFVPIPKREDRRNVEREVEIMNSLQHHLIIQLYAAYEYQKMMCVVLELVEGGELFDRVIDDEFILTERVCTVFMRQVCEAMQFIHRNKILHLDLKPENILCLTKEGNRIKIIDFGLARKYDPDKKLQILFGTPEFVAPEVVNFDSISFGTDMWSVGVICYVLLSGLSPFMGETDIETMANVTIAKYDFDDEAFHNVSSEALDFITKILVKDIEARMTASECLEHKWLQRRPRAPQVAAKPTEVSPPKYKTTRATPSPSTVLDEPIKNEQPIVSPVNVENEQQVRPSVVEDFEKRKDSEEMETTKDNLKHFIERWESHPNSPYIFDSESNLIVPIRDEKADSVLSSRACSPSPCESLAGISTENEDEHNLLDSTETLQQDEKMPSIEDKEDIRKSESPTIENDKNFKDYLQSFDRRNSDTNYILGRRSSGEKVNLADEIKKLSEHLLMLSEINTKLERENNDDEDTKGNQTDTVTETDKPKSRLSDRFLRSQSVLGDLPTTKSYSSPFSSNFFNNKSSSVIKSQQTSTSCTSSSNFTETSRTKLSNAGPATRISSLTVRLQSLDRSPTTQLKSRETKSTSYIRSETSSNIMNGFRSALASETSSASSSRPTSRNQSLSPGFGVPWQVTSKRTKFRINQMSRDVPVGSPNTHQSFNLEDAANTTKDCLLHLLEKYNQTRLKPANGPSSRHQSISVDWNTSDNLEYRSMSSINAFFQRHSCNGGTVRQLQAQLQTKKKNK